MIIKYHIVADQPKATFEPQSFGPVRDKDDLRVKLAECICEQISIDVGLSDDDVDVFFELLKADGSVDPDLEE